MIESLETRVYRECLEGDLGMKDKKGFWIIAVGIVVMVIVLVVGLAA